MLVRVRPGAPFVPSSFYPRTSRSVQQSAVFTAEFHRRSLETFRIDPVEFSKRDTKKVSFCVCWVDPEKSGITTMLTQLKITAAKSRPKAYNITDGQGLVLAVQTTGSKLWRFRYRYGGRQKVLHLRPWSDTSIADAREKCCEARRASAAGPGGHAHGVETIATYLRAPGELRQAEWSELDCMALSSATSSPEYALTSIVSFSPSSCR
jgi:hypothetical protein